MLTKCPLSLLSGGGLFVVVVVNNPVDSATLTPLEGVAEGLTVP